MKTTVELPDALAAEARAVASASGVTLRELIIDGLRTSIDRRRDEEAAEPFRFITVSGRGLQPGAEPQHWNDLGYGAP